MCAPDQTTLQSAHYKVKAVQSKAKNKLHLEVRFNMYGYMVYVSEYTMKSIQQNTAKYYPFNHCKMYK